MSKRKRKPPRLARPTAEPPPVETLIVAWMLTVMTALVCELGFAAARAFLLLAAGPAPMIEALATILLFAATVIGTVSLVLAVAVLSSRGTPPPRGILVFSLAVGAAPPVTLLLRWLLNATPLPST